MMFLNRISQLGYVTDDIEMAARSWIKATNAGPFFVLKGMALENWSYMGAPQDMSLDIAFGQLGNLMVELIRPNGAWPNVYGETMPRGCRAHHHGYLVGDLDAAASGLDSALITQANLSTDTELRYFDCREQLGLFVELITDSGESRAFFDLAKQAAMDWDGKAHPVRQFNLEDN